MIAQLLFMLAVAGVLLYALTRQPRQENTMCGCKKHHDPEAACTCICPEHRNFDRAYELAMQRYDEVVDLRRRLKQGRRDWERQVLQHVLANAPADRPDGDVVPDWIGAISTAMLETREAKP